MTAMIHPSPAEAQLTVACEAGRWTIYLAGDLYLEGRAHVLDVAGLLAERRVAQVTIDLGHVASVDSTGYESIDRAASVIESWGGTVKVVNVP